MKFSGGTTKEQKSGEEFPAPAVESDNEEEPGVNEIDAANCFHGITKVRWWCLVFEVGGRP